MSDVIEDEKTDLIKRATKDLNKVKISLMSHPNTAFFTTVCLSMKQRMSFDIPTAQTDGTTIIYNPNFFMKLNHNEQLFLVLHETMHVAYMHMLRAQHLNAQKYNIAADYVINGQLIERGFSMPVEGLHDSQYKGMSAEEVYKLLKDRPQETLRPDVFGEDLAQPTGTPTEQEALESNLENILIRAKIQSVAAGDKAGSIPGDIEIFIDNLINPKLPWYTILRKFMNVFNKDDYSFKRPSRRFFPEYILPSQFSESLGSIAIAVDVSGSVTQEEFDHFVSEAWGIMKGMKPTYIDFLQFDTRIISVDRLTDVNSFAKVKFQGRGGTSIHAVMDWAAENKPQVLLVFSDGCFSMPVVNPKIPVIWLISEQPFTPPFGKVIPYNLSLP